MQSHFHQELDNLKMLILQMSALAERALGKATRALLERNTDLAGEVLKGDRDIDMLELEIDKICLRLLALDQPVARDLRFIVCCMRIAVDLERIGDQAVNVAQRATFLSSRPPLPRNPSMERLAEVAMNMTKLVIASFVDGNVDQAMEVCQMDDTADDLNVSILKNLLDYMVNEVPAVERSVQMIIAARCLERAADQATNIAESVIFMVNGLNIKHRCQEVCKPAQDN